MLNTLAVISLSFMDIINFYFPKVVSCSIYSFRFSPSIIKASLKAVLLRFLMINFKVLPFFVWKIGVFYIS
jgi:hypothetical protein